MMVLVTGGASCGKSAYAEQIACSFSDERYYLAAMKPFGEEGARRIARHRALRAGKGFVTIECFDGLDQIDEQGVRPSAHSEMSNSARAGRTRTALLESLGNVVANELFRDDGTCASYDEALAAAIDGVKRVAGLFDNLVIVGDEVGGDGIRYDEKTETYMRVIGAAACAIAASSDVVFECVAGEPRCIKNTAGFEPPRRMAERS